MTLVSNIGQADATDTITISATESAEATFRVPATDNRFELTGIILDVKTASETLAVTINVSITGISATFPLKPIQEAHNYTFSGSAGTAGRQLFTLDDPYHKRANMVFGTHDEAILYFDLTMTISGEGAGTAHIGATATSAEDTGGQSGFAIQNPTSGGTIPRFTLVGHTAAVPFIYHAEVLSEPGDGTSYKVGDAIDILFLITQSPEVNQSAPNEAVLWLGNGAEHQRTAQLVATLYNRDFSAILYSYEVQSGDSDTDGILIGDNPLGHNDDFAFVGPLSRVPVDLTLSAAQMEANQSVDGSMERACQETQCITLNVELGSGYSVLWL